MAMVRTIALVVMEMTMAVTLRTKSMRFGSGFYCRTIYCIDIVCNSDSEAMVVYGDGSQIV